MEQKLEGSKYGTADILDHIAKRFDETAKLRLFRNGTENQYILFSPLEAVVLRLDTTVTAGTGSEKTLPRAPPLLLEENREKICLV